MPEIDFARQRQDLVAELRALGIRDEAVLATIGSVPREAFVPFDSLDQAYCNAPLSIGLGQTISQPLVVAHMAEAARLSGGERVLEVGAGSGYAAAVLSRLAHEVFTVERLHPLADSAAERLKRLGYANIHVHCADGAQGWDEHAPYDAIIVAAGGPWIPPALLEQLAIGGRLIFPLGERSQRLVRAIRRTQRDYDYDDLGAVRFVPLVVDGR